MDFFKHKRRAEAAVNGGVWWLILMLDFFVFSTIYYGMFVNSQQVISPTDVVPYTCEEMVIDKKWDTENAIEKISNLTIYEFNVGWIDHQKPVDGICRSLLDLVEQIQGDKGLVALMNQRKQLERQYNEQDAYQKQVNPSAKMKLSEITSIDQTLKQQPLIQSFFKALTDAQAQSQVLETSLKSLRAFYPVKVFISNMLYLLPLFGLFCFWYIHSLRRNKNLSIVISAHMIVLSFIPILQKMMAFLYDMLPLHWLKDLVLFLFKWDLVASWFYLLIGLGIGLAFIMIYFIQVKLKSAKVLQHKRLARGGCVECGIKMPGGRDYCPFCGAFQKMECGMCHELTEKAGSFCTCCGQKLAEDKVVR